MVQSCSTGLRPGCFFKSNKVGGRAALCESLVIVKAVDEFAADADLQRRWCNTSVCVRCVPRWLLSLWACASSEVIPAQSQSKPRWINIQLILISSDKLADGSPVLYFCPSSSFSFLFMFFFLSLDRSDLHLSPSPSLLSSILNEFIITRWVVFHFTDTYIYWHTSVAYSVQSIKNVGMSKKHVMSPKW